MKSTLVTCLVLCTLPALADFQYQSTARITGGTLLQMIRFVPGAGKLREPQVSTVAVHGSRMLHKTAGVTQIIDLDKRTITSIDGQKRTYSVMTFDQMRQAIDDMNAKLQNGKQQGGPDMNMDFKLESTGQTRTIEGYDTKESIFTMSMNMTDPRTGQSGAMVLKLDMWIAPEVAGYSEVRDFYKRMGKEIDWAPGGATLLARPDIARAIAKMMTHGGSVDGTPIENIMSIQPAVTGTTDAAQKPAPAPAGTPETPASAIAGALSGRLGGFGGLGRKKQAQPAQDAAPSGPADTSLIQMTMQYSNFSAAPVDPAMFEIPSGYREVPPDLPRSGR